MATVKKDPMLVPQNFKQNPMPVASAVGPQNYAQPVYSKGAPIPTLIRGASSSVAGLSIYDLSELPSNYSILGQRYPIVTKVLQPGQSLKGEPGSLMTMDRDVKMTTGKFIAATKRYLCNQG